MKLMITGAPTVDFRQGNVDLCAAASMASVLSFIGKEAQARSLFKVFSIHIVVKGADPMVVNRVRDEVWNSLDHSKGQMRKLDNGLRYAKACPPDALELGHGSSKQLLYVVGSTRVR